MQEADVLVQWKMLHIDEVTRKSNDHIYKKKAKKNNLNKFFL